MNTQTALPARHPVILLCGLVATAAGLSGCEIVRDERGTLGPPNAQGRRESNSSQGYLNGKGAQNPTSDMASPTLPDMASGRTCRAAMGLAGEVLLCVDFDGATPDLAGWTLDAGCSGGYGWEVGTIADPMKGKALQLRGFTTYPGPNCGFTPPAIPIGTYSRLTLAIEHSVDVFAPSSNPPFPINQLAEIDRANSPGAPRLGTFYSADKGAGRWLSLIYSADLGGANTFQPLFILRSGLVVAGSNFEGWRIKSIAILGEK